MPPNLEQRTNCLAKVLKAKPHTKGYILNYLDEINTEDKIESNYLIFHDKETDRYWLFKKQGEDAYQLQYHYLQKRLY